MVSQGRINWKAGITGPGISISNSLYPILTCAQWVEVQAQTAEISQYVIQPTVIVVKQNPGLYGFFVCGQFGVEVFLTEPSGAFAAMRQKRPIILFLVANQ
jgi:hypothetical protein